MLQRAASNAYSWWAASHIRTKQSNWLEQSLQDMQGKVESVIKLIEEDGDSFAKRAEMYYKKRPELINFVEESYRAYRALAERYDHLSKELQTANNTIATIFPEQIQLAMEEEDEFGAPKMPKDFKQIPPSGPKDLKGLMSTTSKLRPGNKSSKTEDVSKSGLQKSEAIEEIDKLQKDILALQTVKEFVRSSYKNGLEKYRGMENQIMEKQQKICELEDEFGEGRVIEDAEACTLMAEAALQSCQETLTQLQEKQDVYTQEAQGELKKIEDSRKKLKSFRRKYLRNQTDEPKTNIVNIPNQIELLDKIDNQIDASSKGSNESLTISQLAEKIDELVNKVISLETEVTSQTLLIDKLRREADELQKQVQSLEDDKAVLMDDTQNLNIRVTAIEAKLQTIEILNKDVVNQNSNLRTHFVEARANVDHLSGKLSSVKPDEELDGTDSLLNDVTTLVEFKLKEDPVKQKDHPSTIKTEDKTVRKEQHSILSDKGEVKKTTKKHVTFLQPTPAGKGNGQVSDESGSSVYETQTEKVAEKDDELNWQQMLLSGLDDKDNILLNDYKTILKDYKEVTKKLNDMEKKDRETELDLTLQIREFKYAITKRDEEIHNLRRKLSLLQQGNTSENKELEEEKCQACDPSFAQTLKHEDLPERKDEHDEEDIKTIVVDQRASVSQIEGKLRVSINAILNENLDFWLRFSSAFHQIQKFKNTINDLQREISKLKDREMQDNNSPKVDTKSEIRPIYKHMKEIQYELTLWLSQTLSLKDELERKFFALCSIQDEIAKALKEGVALDEFGFSSHQAAKFQGEIFNMKRENNKVREELEAGVRRVTILQVDVEKTTTQLDQEFGINGNQSQLMHAVSKSRIPLHSFIFGTKPKKQKCSVFSRIKSSRS